jgi:hypothetical protein
MMTLRVQTKKSATFALLFSVFIGLQGCGGERDEPFDPGTDDEDDDYTVSVEHIVEAEDSEPLFSNGSPKAKRLEIIKDEDEYLDIFSDYIADSSYEAPDFATGQILLYDAGDSKVCARKLILQQVAAHENATNENVVRVTLTYREKAATAAGSCADENAETRPFKFIYIKTRKDIIISETL